MRILTFVFILFMLCVPRSEAQYTTIFYSSSLQATGITTTATHTRGYDVQVPLRSDAVSYITKQLNITFSKTTDSAKVQGMLTLGNGTKQWYDIPITVNIHSALDVGAGTKVSRDTVVYWLTPVGTGAANYNKHNPGSTGLFDIPPGYESYRVVSGKNDSGVVYINAAYIRNR